MYRTRKLIFTAAALMLVSILFTCAPYGPEDYEEPGEYPPGIGSVTIYLDDSAPVSYSRGLNLSLAKLGHDLFEIAFFHPGSGVIARAVWETGHAAGVSGVYRGVNGAGVDYQYATVSAVPPGAGNGAAILFVGKKSDRTLLALGRLTHVNGKPVTTIDADSRTVTFSVAALRAGVSTNKGTSSFLTDSTVATSADTTYDNVSIGSTDVFNVMIGYKPFPLFRVLGGNLYVHGKYKFEVVGENVPDAFDTIYGDAIRLKSHVQSDLTVFPPGPDGTTTFRRPRYPRPEHENEWETSKTGLSDLDEDPSTPVAVTNNTGGESTNAVFQNPVNILIGQTNSGMNGHVFAFSFQIPVYPLNNAGNRAADFSWYLRPGYDSYLYDLDDGVGGGGSILIGTGEFEQTTSSALTITKPPNKTKYPGNSGNYIFTSAGIEVVFQVNPGAIKIPVQGATGQIYYVVAGKALIAGDNIEPILIANRNPQSGIVTVTVEYYANPSTDASGPPYDPVTGAYNPSHNAGPLYTALLEIYYIPIPPSMNFNVPDGNRYVITNDEDWRSWRNNGITTGNTYIIVFFKNFNIGDAITVPAGVSVIMIAGEPNIIIGKTVTLPNAINDESTAVNRNVYFFGVWPFDDILAIDGMAIDSKPFYINAGGPYGAVIEDPNNPGQLIAPGATGLFINGGGTNKIIDSGGVTIINPGNFQ